LMSPIFLFMPRFRGDAWKLQPQRLGVLVKYGEGPHMSALGAHPIALAFTWLSARKAPARGRGLAAVFSAGVAANNFYGATALGGVLPHFWSGVSGSRGRTSESWLRPSPFRFCLRAHGLLAGAFVLPGHVAEYEVRFRTRNHRWSIWERWWFAVALR